MNKTLDMKKPRSKKLEEKKNAQKQYKMLMNFMKIYESQQVNNGQFLTIEDNNRPELQVTPKLSNIRMKSMILPQSESLAPARRRAVSRHADSNTEIRDSGLVSHPDCAEIVIAFRNHKTGVYQCNTCPKKENTKEEIENHHKSVHVGEYTSTKSRSTRRSLGLPPKL